MNDLNPIDFVLTQRERDVAAHITVELEANRRRQNRREADLGLARWRGDQHRPQYAKSGESS